LHQVDGTAGHFHHEIQLIIQSARRQGFIAPGPRLFFARSVFCRFFSEWCHWDACQVHSLYWNQCYASVLRVFQCSCVHMYICRST
jgi:hypothetical protein